MAAYVAGFDVVYHTTRVNCVEAAGNSSNAKDMLHVPQRPNTSYRIRHQALLVSGLSSHRMSVFLSVLGSPLLAAGRCGCGCVPTDADQCACKESMGPIH